MVIGALEPAFPPQPPVQKPKMHVQAAEGAACEAGIPQSLLVDEVPLQGITLRGPQPYPCGIRIPSYSDNQYATTQKGRGACATASVEGDRCVLQMQEVGDIRETAQHKKKHHDGRDSRHNHLHPIIVHFIHGETLH